MRKKDEPPVHIRLHPKQALVLKSLANEILFGGAAGVLVRAAAIGYCTAIPGLQAYLFRRTYPELCQATWKVQAAFACYWPKLWRRAQPRLLRTRLVFLTAAVFGSTTASMRQTSTISRARRSTCWPRMSSRKGRIKWGIVSRDTGVSKKCSENGTRQC